MCRDLDNARHLAVSQRSTEGGIAKFFLAQLQFPHEGIIAALDKEGDTMLYGTPIVLPGTLGFGGLRPHFAFRCGIMYVACSNDNLQTKSIEFPMTTYQAVQDNVGLDANNLMMGLVSADSNLLLQYRGLSMSVNGPGVPALSGMLDFMRGKRAAAEALKRGAICAFCIHNGRPNNSVRVVNCLHLDKSSR